MPLSILDDNDAVPFTVVDSRTVAILGAFWSLAPSRHAIQMPSILIMVFPFCVLPPAMISGIVSSD